MDLEERLRRLGAIFGEGIGLEEKPEHGFQGNQLVRKNVKQPGSPRPEKTNKSYPDDQGNQENAPKDDTVLTSQERWAFDTSNLTVTEQADMNVEFCPWKMIETYPTNFVGKANRATVTAEFERIFEDRVWDFFYLYHAPKPRNEPCLFVPTAQFKIFLSIINARLKTALCIPHGVHEAKFTMTFGQGGMPRPRYLGRIYDKGCLDTVKCPLVDVRSHVIAFNSGNAVQRRLWQANLKMVDSTRRDDQKQKRAEISANKKAERERMLRQTQGLLGLDNGKVLGEPGSRAGPVFVCVDVEAIERPPNPVSEIGIAILDQGQIRGVRPGPCGRDWWPFIEAHHLRTKELSGLVNHKYIKGCPGAFDFGTSSFPTRRQLASKFKSILKPYLDDSRDLVLVGHDTKQDIGYMASIGVDLEGMQGIKHVLDSQAIHQAWKEVGSGRSLETVLADLGMMSKNLHNAGNDAVYTMRALIGVSVEQIRQKQAEEDGEVYEPALWNA